MYMFLGRVSLLDPSPDRCASGRDTTPDAIAMEVRLKMCEVDETAGHGGAATR